MHDSFKKITRPLYCDPGFLTIAKKLIGTANVTIDTELKQARLLNLLLAYSKSPFFSHDCKTHGLTTAKFMLLLSTVESADPAFVLTGLASPSN